MSADLADRVFDDENDRWIAVLPGETDRDALLRARREGAPSVMPPQGTGRDGASQRRINRPLRALIVIAAAGIGVGVPLFLIAASTATESFTSFHEAAGNSVLAATGSFLVLIGAFAGLFALTTAAMIDHLEHRRR